MHRDFYGVIDAHGIRLLVVISAASGGPKNAILRRSMTSIDFSSINFLILAGTAEPTDPAPEQT